MGLTKIRAVLFDVGETLLNFDRIDSSRAFKEAAESSYRFLQQLGVPTGGFRRYYLHNMISLHIRILWSNVTGRDFDALAALKQGGAKKGLSLSDEQWQKLAWLWYEPLSRLASVESDILQTLGDLKQLGLKLGIVSNTFINSCSLDRHFAQLGMLEFFPVRIYSYMIKSRKPAKRIFEIAAEKLAVPCQETMFVGDRIDTDIKGAIKARMTAVLKRARTNHRKKVPAGVFSVDSLSQLPMLIKQINGGSA
ncbi:MAG: HAD family hydrolase [Planctomycetota bacterium]